jgi:hypothetical protein
MDAGSGCLRWNVGGLSSRVGTSTDRLESPTHRTRFPKKLLQDDSHIVLEQRNDRIAIAGPAVDTATAEHRVRLDRIAGVGPFRASKDIRSSLPAAVLKRKAVVYVLANLLMQAACAAGGESSNEASVGNMNLSTSRGVAGSKRSR